MARRKKIPEVCIIGWKCGNCRFWRRLDDTNQMPAEDVLGECMRYPPTVIGLDENDNSVQGLPIVQAQHYCGEHQGVIN